MNQFSFCIFILIAIVVLGITIDHFVNGPKKKEESINIPVINPANPTNDLGHFRYLTLTERIDKLQMWFKSTMDNQQVLIDKDNKALYEALEGFRKLSDRVDHEFNQISKRLDNMAVSRDKYEAESDERIAKLHLDHIAFRERMADLRPIIKMVPKKPKGEGIGALFP